ncbi:short chain dehydrogenase reductase [Xylogone sp. PMI_703]|nr:short chain dehydrogenase reductase [Xylogone sp. PMI_703]
MSSLSKTIALVSGANTGIGLAVATKLAKEHKDYHVIVGSRNAAAGVEVAKSLSSDGASVSSVQLDLTSDESIASSVKYVESNFGRLDILINNAGILLDSSKDLSTRQLFTQTFSTNVIGTACLTEAFLPLLRKSALPRIVFVSSRMGSIAVSTDSSTFFYNIDYKSYDASKAAVNMLAVNYARILKDQGGMVNAVCPQLIKTKLNGFMEQGQSPEVGALRIVELATSGKNGPTATFSDKDGPIPW